mgnify:CR=1 FL=1
MTQRRVVGARACPQGRRASAPGAEHGSGVTAITAPPPGAAKVNWSRRTQALSTDPAIWESPGERVGVSRPTS